ncbi:hypothetical protein MJO28_009729 [Puccinia striiformis f. sp. tritici]|uniref:Uncharacterized protein n=1 Tax=Puccinia striiformis f. sp. tritici TaxID=168172 RepID=A0ACC0E7Y2_9BASI|nr:hypothetical protein MJO28_009729 [Puccinia striiformis f. sp. tritici]
MGSTLLAAKSKSPEILSTSIWTILPLSFRYVIHRSRSLLPHQTLCFRSQVNSVAVTTGHQIGRVHGPATASPSGSKNGRKFKTFSNNKPNVNSNQPRVDPRKDAFTNTSSDVEMSPADCSPSDPKGKRKAATMEQVVESDSYDSDAPIVNSAACSSTKTRPCPNILQEAAKRLKQM